MKKTLLTIVLAALCLNFTNKAAAQTSRFKSLTIGDTIPEALWNLPLKVINHPSGKQTITLNEYRNKKLIILDFWATWCSPCIASIDKLSPIYHENAADMMLLPIAAHQGKSIQQAAALMKEKKWTVPSIVDAEQFLYKDIFPPVHGSGIPHMVWIKGSKVIAIPQTAYATKENISKAINGEALDMVMDTVKLDTLNYLKPLFVAGNGKTGVYFRKGKFSVIARHLPGYATGRKTAFLQTGDTSILAAVNRSLPDLLFDAYRLQIFPKLTAKTGIVWNISDTLKNRLFNGPAYDKTHELNNELKLEAWQKYNTYGYNLRFPERISEQEAYYFMQQDLSQFFALYLNLTFSIKPLVKHTYAVLHASASISETTNLLAHKGEIKNRDPSNNYNKHYTQIFLATINNALTGLTLPQVVDSTGIAPGLKVDFRLPENIKGNPLLLAEALKPYGLKLSIRESYVPVLVVTEQKKANTKITTKPH